MKIVIKFKIDTETLEYAISSLLYLGEKISKKSILERIKSEVYQKGHDVVNFPEYWGDDIRENLDNDLIQKFVEKYSSLVGL